MVKLVASVCPKCGAKVKIPKEEGRGFCNFCGTEILMDDEVIKHSVKMDKSGDETTLIDLGETAMDAGQFQEAIGYMKQALEINPKNISSWINYAASCGGLAYGEGVGLSYAKRSNTYFMKAITIAKKSNKEEDWALLLNYFDNTSRDTFLQETIIAIMDANSTKKKYKMMIKAGQHLRNQGKEEEAMQLFEEAKKIKPDDKELVEALKEENAGKAKSGGGGLGNTIIKIIAFIFGLFLLWTFVSFIAFLMFGY
ncbi:tetratricopeptide repeat protein [archaeon]